MFNRKQEQTQAINRSKLASAAWRAVLVALAMLHMGAADDDMAAGAADEGCTLGDAEFEPGATVICPDGCNECTCAEDGQWSSTLVLCEPAYAQTCEESAQSSSVVSAEPLYHDGDKLALAVQYRGGCFAHTWKLCASEAREESGSVETRLWVLDTTTEHDACYALPTVELAFDLAPIRERLEHTHPGSKNVSLQLGGQTIAYSLLAPAGP